MKEYEIYQALHTGNKQAARELLWQAVGDKAVSNSEWDALYKRAGGIDEGEVWMSERIIKDAQFNPDPVEINVEMKPKLVFNCFECHPPGSVNRPKLPFGQEYTDGLCEKHRDERWINDVFLKKLGRYDNTEVAMNSVQKQLAADSIRRYLASLRGEDDKRV